jgi:hypothetical protein
MPASQTLSGAMLYFTAATSSISYRLVQFMKRPPPSNSSLGTNHHSRTFESSDAKPMHTYPNKSVTNLLPPRWSAST